MTDRRLHPDRRRRPRGGRRATDHEFEAQVVATKDAVLVQLGAAFNDTRKAMGLTVAGTASAADLSERSAVTLLNGKGSPTLDTLIAVALALGGSLSITFHPRATEPHL